MTEKIFLIGAGIVDVLVRPAEREVFEAGSYAAEEISMAAGGDALNEATVLARLGKQVELCTVLGNDAAGEFVETHCGKEGISLKYAKKDQFPTGVNVVLVQKNGERSFLTMSGSSLRKLSLVHIPEVFPKDVGIVSLASMFVSPLLGITEMLTIFQRAKAQGKILCADMTKRKNGETLEDIRELLPYVDYLMPNQEEAALLTGCESSEESAECFFEAGVKNVVIKCGKKGCFIRNQNVRKWVPAIPGITPVDTTGAGDCFVGGFLYALSEGCDLENCARFGNVCGSLVVETAGATNGIRDLEQVKERCREKQYLKFL